MNIGDKVRMLRGREEGVVTRLLEGQLVEVEIEEGFKIPVLRSELAVVAADEGRLMGRAADAPSDAPAGKFSGPVLATRGVYLAFVSVNDREMSLYVLNNTDWEVPFTLGEEADGKYQGTAAGVLKRKTSLKTREVLINEFEQWPTFVLQLLFHRQGFGTPPAPLVKRMRFRANTFFKSKQKAPLLDREAHLFQVDEETVTIEPAKILDRMRENTAPAPSTPVTKPAPVVDLHIEQLTRDSAKMSNSAMLQLQLDTFEKQLESAIASGMADITFIHGLGNGTLRTELHKRLGRHPHVQYYEDAQKEKFGYGATKVKIK